MKTLLYGTEGDRELANETGATLVLNIRDAQRFLREHQVVVVMITLFDRQNLAFAGRLVSELARFGSALDIIIAVGFDRNRFGELPSGLLACPRTAVNGVVSEAIAYSRKRRTIEEG